MPARGTVVWPVRAGWPRPVGAAPPGGRSQRAEEESNEASCSFAVGELHAATTNENRPTTASGNARRRSMTVSCDEDCYNLTGDQASREERRAKSHVAAAQQQRVRSVDQINPACLVGNQRGPPRGIKRDATRLAARFETGEDAQRGPVQLDDPPRKQQSHVQHGFVGTQRHAQRGSAELRPVNLATAGDRKSTRLNSSH